MKRQIDLNSDLGEGFGRWPAGEDAALLDQVSSANIACGFHAGDPTIMRATVAAALQRGVSLGAHPSTPDLQGFGRRTMAISPEEAYAITLYQVGALDAFARAAGARLRHVKPHGALYNMAARDTALAQAIAAAVRDYDAALMLYGLAGSELIAAAREVGLHAVSEAFADRSYLADGSLMPRTRPGSVIHDERQALAQVEALLTHGRVSCPGGGEAQVEADTLCVHGDSPQALALLVAIRAWLAAHGVAVRAPGA